MIEVVLCSDNNYVSYAAVTIASTIVHCSHPESLRFHLLTVDADSFKLADLAQMVANLGAQLSIYEVQVESFLELELDRFGIGTILRLLMQDYLSQQLERVIYLDCDILVLSDLSALWGQSLNGQVVGAVTDLCNPQTYKRRQQIYSSYFNAGVLLVDIVRWRHEKIGLQALRYLSENISQLPYYDQDALNYIIGDNWHSLDLRWNFQPAAYSAFDKNYNYLQERRDELEAAIRKPAVVHFIGGTKPWHARCRHPLQDLFLFYSQFTPWPIDKQALRSQLTFYERAKRLLRLPKQWRRQQMLDYKKPDFVALERL